MAEVTVDVSDPMQLLLVHQGRPFGTLTLDPAAMTGETPRLTSREKANGLFEALAIARSKLAFVIGLVAEDGAAKHLSASLDRMRAAPGQVALLGVIQDEARYLDQLRTTVLAEHPIARHLVPVIRLLEEASERAR